ncbi:hypothetical protein FG386_002273 [Cryptosporidium ryanae]|uniref:uncharacterized protein n=1 Tax=Cryptosporidium ryanae TaxID=515981 RepID=UPI00351A531B|nr:hypothetical protein FG386_002273 [Cryptosporidium ryanae]
MSVYGNSVSVDSDGFLWSFASTDSLDGKERINYCLNNYIYDTSKDGFLGEGSFFRAYRAKRLKYCLTDKDFKNGYRCYDEKENEYWVTFRVGLISCLKSQKVSLNKRIKLSEEKNDEDSSEQRTFFENIILSVYDRILLESLIMSKLNHVNIPKLFEIIQVPEYNQIVLVQEYFKNQIMYRNRESGTYTAIESSECNIVYSEKISLIVLAQLLDCLEYLHEFGVVHRDLKPENIFLSGNIDKNDLVYLRKDIVTHKHMLDDDSIFESESEQEYNYFSEFNIKSNSENGEDQNNSFFFQEIDEPFLENSDFEEGCIWYDSPFFESYSEAKTEIKKIFAPKNNEQSEYPAKRNRVSEDDRNKYQDEKKNDDQYFLFFGNKTTDIRGLFNPSVIEKLSEVGTYKTLLDFNELPFNTDLKKNHQQKQRSFCVKLSDFNSCILVDKDHLVFDRDGSMLFTPPECFSLECTTKGVDGFKRDIWSLGCVIYSLINGKVPYYGRNTKEYLDSIKNELLTFRDGISSNTKQIIVGMLKENPVERASIREIREMMRNEYN